jgi:hypothetical protein
MKKGRKGIQRDEIVKNKRLKDGKENKESLINRIINAKKYGLNDEDDITDDTNSFENDDELFDILLEDEESINDINYINLLKNTIKINKNR